MPELLAFWRPAAMLGLLGGSHCLGICAGLLEDALHA
jgi:sulfite exporter TauE/SafE